MKIDRENSLYILKKAVEWQGQQYDICIRPKDAAATLNRQLPDNIDQTIKFLVKGCLESLENQIQGDLENITFSVGGADQNVVQRTNNAAQAILQSNDLITQPWKMESRFGIKTVQDAFQEISRQLHQEVVVVLRKPASEINESLSSSQSSSIDQSDESDSNEEKLSVQQKYKRFFPDTDDQLIETRVRLLHQAIEEFHKEQLPQRNWTQSLWQNLTLDQLLRIDELSPDNQDEIRKAINDQNSPFSLLCQKFLEVDGSRYFQGRLPNIPEVASSAGKSSEAFIKSLLETTIIKKITNLWIN